MHSLMFFELAQRNVRLHWLRSLLAILGIIIGVVTIVSMGILGNSLVLAISDSLSTVGDSIIVTPHVGGMGFGGSQSSNLLSDRDVEQIRRAAAPHVTIPVYSGSSRMKIGSEDTVGTIYGLKPDDIPVLLEVDQGSYLRGASGAMVGATFAEENEIKVGSRISLGEMGSVRVVGILKERGMGFDINPDFGIVVEDQWFKQAFGQEEYNQVIVKVNDLNKIEEVKDSIDRTMNRKETVVDVIDTRAILETILTTFGQISTFTTVIGGISLIVAGVSILNIMLMSVTERIKEIGVIEHRNAEKGSAAHVPVRSPHSRPDREFHRRGSLNHRRLCREHGDAPDHRIPLCTVQSRLYRVRSGVRPRDQPHIRIIPRVEGIEPEPD